MTIGISPKAKLAALVPAIAAVVGVLIQWAVTGTYDKAELATSITGLSAAALAFVAAYLGSPGEVTTVVGPASDTLLSEEAKDKLSKIH